jgi:hypothetical protein
MLYQLVIITSLGVTPWQGVQFQNLEQCMKEKTRLSASLNTECMPIMSQEQLQKNLQSSIMMMMSVMKQLPQ